MGILTGIDGCKNGWICISKDMDTAKIYSEVFPNAKSLLKQLSGSVILAVDIPIGLSEDERRLCDIQAKKLLGSRHTTVFFAPIRPAVKASNHKEANDIQRKICQHGLSIQAFSICYKIREFDEILSRQPRLQQRIKEVHPEVCFWAWNGNRNISYSKKTTEGAILRHNLIADHFGIEAVKDIRSKYSCKTVADDDIHDAFASLWTAERILRDEASRIPDTPRRDEKGLYMEIWY
ncbi:MAG: DUF429 domain-containing protein [Planctomycetota bacterium]